VVEKAIASLFSPFMDPAQAVVERHGEWQH
jgi:hypothetical protein